ncbi:MAG TPA: LysM peptidoglycan-binding domain-containing protein, partial [Anaerolineae bacterium]|nr:LysM peptidoglycan-binding domain-containing protein [Anaerolineae bacterium]
MVQQNFATNLDDAIYQAASARAQSEGKSLDQVMIELLGTYAKDAPAVTSYTVQRGDTLSKIARTVYGDAYKYPLIQQANNLTDPGHIWVGQVLVIPAIVGATPAPPPQPAPPPPAPSPPPQP